MSEKNEKQLSDEFKKDIKDKRSTNTLLGTFLAFLAIVLVFGTVGVAGYQMLFRPAQTENKSASEKIESRPEVTKKDTETTAPVTPVVVEPTTPVETAPVATSKSYVIVSGDTWSSVANANGISSAKLMEYNGTTSEDLQIGQTIKLP